MKKRKILIACVIVATSVTTSFPAISTELGLGYGKQFLGNTEIEQYEWNVRAPLPFKWKFCSDLTVFSAVEAAMARLREAHSENDQTARFSLMPQVILNPHPNINFIIGLGTGFMVGGTEFTKHDLGGSLLFSSKVGIQYLLGQHWNVGYVYYHQSNGGIYEHNASLNMHQLALSYTF